MKTIIRKREQGAVAPLVGILMVVFILCIALVVDLGHLHNVKVQLQRAVDAAALAGAQQLDGETGQDSDALAVARAAAAANRVNGLTGLAADGGWVDNSSVVVTLGRWDPDNLGAPAAERFSSPSGSNTANAVKVAATLEIEHFFFFLSSGSTVSADAIAVNRHVDTALPIALLSCVPVNEGLGKTICDIELYKFNDDTSDTSGWTALTYDISAAQLKYFFTTEGNEIIKKVMFGSGDGQGGLENFKVMTGDSSYDPSIPCSDKNVELDIKCGLGPDFATDPAPADPFDYVLNDDDSLPRWADDAFARIYSMDGILLPGFVPGETDAAYELRLESLLDASNNDDYTTYESTYHALESYMKDGRFSKLIGPDPNGPKTIAYLDQALHFAGYPMVQAKNGSDNAVLQEFIDLATDGTDHFKNSLVKVNPPLNATSTEDINNSYGGGGSFAVTMPVIFAGVCGEWKSLKGKYYIGTAKLMITRIWQGVNACYDASDPVTVYGSPPCTIGEIVPQLGGSSGDNYECVTGHSSGAQAGIEALIQPPVDDEETEFGIQKIYLVE